MARITSIPENVTAHFSKRTLSGTDAARAYAESQGLDWDSLSPDRKVGLLKAGVQNPRDAKTNDVSDLTAWRASADGLNYQYRSVLRPSDPQPTPTRDERLENAYQPMLDYATGGGAGMGLLLLHDDEVREYAYGPATGLPQSGIGSFPQALYDRARAQGWTVISMKHDWNRVFAFE
jgi:hypothetical protein